ncbi:MAG: NTPase [Burkholderiales bacterium]|nr:NTPase [Burkholderiales bacterium]
MSQSPMPKSRRILLLTGSPGVGKTTVIRRVVECLQGRRLAGFYTQEIREHGVRRGFRLTTLDDQEKIMAHVDFDKTFRVGRYGVDLAAIEAAVQGSLVPNEATDVYLVDEIGKMECLSTKFIVAMRTLLSADKAVVATVAEKGVGFISEVKSRADVELWRVTMANRDALPARVITRLGLEPAASRSGNGQ